MTTAPTFAPAGSPTGPAWDRSIPVRRPKIDLTRTEMERWLVPGDPIFSHFLAALSSVFPNGEDFFVESVRHYRHQVDGDPEMKAKVKGFIGQESMHGREHRVLNERLERLGYPAAFLDRELLRMARHLQRLPKSVQLSITAASEHFTSVLAEAVLGDAQTRETLFPTPDMETLITWHALEELEHKDVAFDLLQQVSRSYLLRQVGLILAAAGFGSVVVRGYTRGLIRDRRHLTAQAWRRHAHNYTRQRMTGPGSAVAILGYVRPGFHPRHSDTDHLVDEWRARLGPVLSANPRRADGVI